MPSRFPLVHSSVKSRALKGLCLRANEGALSRGPPPFSFSFSFPLSTRQPTLSPSSAASLLLHR